MQAAAADCLTGDGRSKNKFDTFCDNLHGEDVPQIVRQATKSDEGMFLENVEAPKPVKNVKSDSLDVWVLMSALHVATGVPNRWIRSRHQSNTAYIKTIKRTF